MLTNSHSVQKNLLFLRNAFLILLNTFKLPEQLLYLKLKRLTEFTFKLSKQETVREASLYWHSATRHFLMIILARFSATANNESHVWPPCHFVVLDKPQLFPQPFQLTTKVHRSFLKKQRWWNSRSFKIKSIQLRCCAMFYRIIYCCTKTNRLWTT